MSKKLNSFENYFIKRAIKTLVDESEQEIAESELDGKRLIFASGYFEMIGKEMLDKVDSLTLKSALKQNSND